MKLSNRIRPHIILESLIMALVVFMFYFLPGNTQIEFSTTQSANSGLQLENAANKDNVALIFQTKNIVCSGIVVTTKDNNKIKCDITKLYNENKKLHHSFNVISLVELKIKPILHKGFYYFYHPSSQEEFSILA